MAYIFCEDLDTLQKVRDALEAADVDEELRERAEWWLDFRENVLKGVTMDFRDTGFNESHEERKRETDLEDKAKQLLVDLDEQVTKGV